jgi:PAS domain S-box-containing protein
MLDGKGKVLGFNEAFHRFFTGLEKENVFHQTLASEQYRDLVARLHLSTQRKDHELVLRLRHFLSSEKSADLQWQIFVQHQKNETVYFALGVFAETESGLFYSQVLDDITDGFFIVDQAGSLVHVNQSFARLLQLPKDELILSNISHIFSNKESPLFSRNLSRALNKQQAVRLEEYFEALDQWWFFALYPASGQITVYCKDISQRKKNEIILRQSQAKLKAILNSTSEANLLISSEKEVISFNKAAELFIRKTCGISLEEKISFTEIFPSQSRQVFENAIRKALAGDTLKFEHEIEAFDQRKFWFNITFYPVFDDSQQIIGTAVNAENIQERKKAEEQLNMYSLIANHISDAVIITDAEGRTTWVNDSFTRKTGYSLDEMQGLAPGEVLQGPESDPEMIVEMDKAIEEGRSFEVEIINYTKSGTPFYVDIKADPFFNSHGQLQGFIAIQPDITERKKREEAQLKESWSRFHAIFENSINAILLADDQGRYVEMNPAACRISGYSREELFNMKMEDFLQPGEGMTGGDNWDDFLLKGSMEGTVMIKTKQGDLKILDFRAVADILPGLHLSILSDVTEHFHAEKKLLEQKEHLEQLNEEKSRLFSIIAHDLRSPLNNLDSMIKMLQEQFIEKDSFEKYIEILSGRIHHSLNLLDNLFQWAQHQLHGIKINKENFDLYLLGESKLGLFQLAAQKKNIDIHNDIPEGSMVYADINMVDLVIRNLVANAIKFSASGDKVVISAKKENESTVVCISDTGVGILQENLSKIFGFMSTPGTQKEKGSGLGLRICKEFVEKHGGTIWVESEWGKGSRFCFSLPSA